MYCLLILHNIRSVLNVGAIFRTADAAGVTRIYLTGYTPIPLDRFGRVRTDLHKSALGAETVVDWEQREDIVKLVDELRGSNYEILALEQSQKSVDYKSHESERNFALIVGNEVEGVSEEVLNMCDKVIEIPMRGKKESLNVSVAAGIALYRLLNL
jgi:23S rRNA (guanosine2251-2'-O)-methyltransferase